MNCLDCVETVARLHLYLDRELSSEEIEIVQEHLGHCSKCEGRFHFNSSVKRLIHERCTIVRAPEHLRAAVLQLAQQAPGTVVTLDYEVEMRIREDLLEGDE